MARNIAIAVLFSISLVNIVQAADLVVTNSKSGIDERTLRVIHKGIASRLDAKFIKFEGYEQVGGLSYIGDENRVISIGADAKSAAAIAKSSLNPSELIHGAYIDVVPGPKLSLRVDPDKLIESLLDAAPNISHVKTVLSTNYNPAHLATLQASAKKYGLILELVVASSPGDLANKWQAIFAGLDAKKHAIALIDTAHMDKIGGLRYVLKTAWKEDALVITSVPSYTTRGVSIGVALDLFGYGQEIASLLGSGQATETFTKSYKPAINLRHFNHIGISVKSSDFNNPIVFIQ